MNRLYLLSKRFHMVFFFKLFKPATIVASGYKALLNIFLYEVV